MTKPPLLFHLGLHKTGTTAIQRALSDNRDRLSATGIHYPRLQPAFTKDENAHHRLPHALVKIGQQEVRRLAYFRWTLAKGARRHDLTLLSTECAASDIVGRRDGLDTDAWFAGQAALLRRLRLYLGGFRLRGLIYLRQPHDLAESLFKETLSNHRVQRVWQFEAFIAHHPQFFDFDRHLDVIRAAFPEIEVVQYEAEAKAGLIARFFERIGAEPPEGPASFYRKSVSNRGALWLSHQDRAASEKLRRSRIYYAVSDPHGHFAESERSTLWGSINQRKQFLEDHRGTFDLSVLRGLPRWPVAPTTAWTENQQRAANADFVRWSEAHSDLLDERHRLRLPFYKPDPATDRKG